MPHKETDGEISGYIFLRVGLFPAVSSSIHLRYQQIAVVLIYRTPIQKLN